MENLRTIILVPIYKELLSENQERVLRYSFSKLMRHDICFIVPHRLDISFYRHRFDEMRFMFFPDQYFDSPQVYSQLLLNIKFYQRFTNYSHMLIMQTDAVVLQDTLAEWLASPFDFVGAPWPIPYSITLPDVGNAFSGRSFIINVGNGGLSLRRIQSCINVLQECGWINKCLPMDEDLFFSLAGQISKHFLIPNIVRAARFSLEAHPSRFYAMTGELPMGGHAWEKWDKEFWIKIFKQYASTFLIV